MKAGIIGAGIMGRLLAFALLPLGFELTLFDQNPENSCSMAASGLLTPVTELEKSAPIIYQLGIEALQQHWPTILSRLQNTIYFRRQGSLVLSHPNDKSELAHFVKQISIKMNQIATYEKLTSEKLLEHEPDLGRFSEAYFFADEGQVDNQSLLTELENELSHKIRWKKNATVTTVKHNIISTTQEATQFDYVFDCRGTAATDLFSDLRSLRGELIWLHAPDVNITRPTRFLHPHYSLYIVPRPNNVYLIGASEIESDDYSGISVRTTLELLTAAYYVQPKFAEARIIKTVTHCRPTLMNHLPKIKQSDGFFAVNGLYRHGCLIAPTLANEIVNFIRRGASALKYPQLWENLS